MVSINSVLLLYACLFSFLSFFLPIVFFFFCSFDKYIHISINIYDWMNVPGAIFFFANLRLSEIHATKRTNQTFSLRQQERVRILIHTTRKTIYIYAFQRVDQVAYKGIKKKKTVRYVCLSVDAASNRTCTFIIVPYVWICWENVYMCINKKVSTILIDSFCSEILSIYQSIDFKQ